MNSLRPIGTSAEISSPRLRRVYEHWRVKAEGRLGPCRRDIDPAELKHDLPWLWLADVIGSGDDFGFRLAGEHLRSFFTEDYSGKRVSECPRIPFFQNVAMVFAKCVQTRAPLIIGPSRTSYEPRNYREITVIVLPLTENGSDVSMLFGAFEVSGAELAPALSQERSRATAS